MVSIYTLKSAQQPRFINNRSFELNSDVFTSKKIIMHLRIHNAYQLSFRLTHNLKPTAYIIVSIYINPKRLGIVFLWVFSHCNCRSESKSVFRETTNGHTQLSDRRKRSPLFLTRQCHRTEDNPPACIIAKIKRVYLEKCRREESHRRIRARFSDEIDRLSRFFA